MREKNEDNDADPQLSGNAAVETFDGEDYVRWAYRLLLGREPDSPEAVRQNPFKNDRRRLVQAVLNSVEFQNSDVVSLRLAGELGAEFDVYKLRHRDKRFLNIAELRRWAKAVYIGNGKILCKMLGKYKMYVSENDIGLSPHVIIDGFYEYPITEFIVRNVSYGMTVMDLGANYGYYTILMADLVGNIGKVHAFEPNPAAVAALRLSLRVNGYDHRVSIDQRAVWNSSNEKVTFHVPEAAATNARIVWPLDSRLPPSDRGALDAGRTTIETIALDDLPLDGVSFIKADIEGAEERLWQGGRKFLKRNPNIILLLEFNCLRCQDPRGILEDMTQMFALRYLDNDSNIQNTTMEYVLAGQHDWMLVLSKREQLT